MSEHISVRFRDQPYCTGCSRMLSLLAYHADSYRDAWVCNNTSGKFDDGVWYPCKYNGRTLMIPYRMTVGEAQT